MCYFLHAEWFEILRFNSSHALYRIGSELDDCQINNFDFMQICLFIYFQAHLL